MVVWLVRVYGRMDFRRWVGCLGCPLTLSLVFHHPTPHLPLRFFCSFFSPLRTRLSQFDEKGLGYEVLWLNLTSQAWLTEKDSDRSIWWHYVAIIVPNKLNPAFADRGLMYMTGGNQDPKPPKLTGEDLLVGAILAQTCETVVTVLFQIPNSPVHFYGEQPTPKSRTEDAIIAYGWAQYLKDPTQPQWLARLPMTKAGVRAMDAAAQFWQEQTGNTMSQWIVAGASKRGWTAWTVAACDPERVVGVVPMVVRRESKKKNSKHAHTQSVFSFPSPYLACVLSFVPICVSVCAQLDELNFVKNIHHQWRAYGGWSFALKDYIAENITTEFDSENFAKAMSIVDPIAYTDILTMPKFIISTGGDEFLMPDNNDYYWSELQGEKHFHQFPNLEHTYVVHTHTERTKVENAYDDDKS